VNSSIPRCPLAVMYAVREMCNLIMEHIVRLYVSNDQTLIRHDGRTDGRMLDIAWTTKVIITYRVDHRDSISACYVDVVTAVSRKWIKRATICRLLYSCSVFLYLALDITVFMHIRQTVVAETSCTEHWSCAGAATICPAHVTLTFDLLTLKVVS